MQLYCKNFFETTVIYFREFTKLITLVLVIKTLNFNINTNRNTYKQNLKLKTYL